VQVDVKDDAIVLEVLNDVVETAWNYQVTL
jgi:hypothetical protein